jgi:hypothetical protein
MVVEEPAAAPGSEFTVTVTVPVLVQPVAVTFSVKVYVVEEAGLAVGLETVDELSAVVGDQE